jgi:competence protein ComEC
MFERPMLSAGLACATASFVACAPAERTPWSPGELRIAQLLLPGPAFGESALIIGPSGFTALVDAGNDGHEGAVEDAISAHGAAGVDVLLVTHRHTDHIGSLDGIDLDPGLLVAEGSVGYVEDTNVDEWEEVVGRGWAQLELCDGNGCPGLSLGGPEAGDEGSATTWDLGEGASLTLWAAAGRTVSGEAFDAGTENARSVVFTVSWGGFTYLAAGDLTGGQDGTPDMEAAYAGALGLSAADVLHLSHHGKDTASNEAWLDAVLGDPAVAVAGTNAAYGNAPDDDVLDRVSPRVDGVFVPERGAVSGRDPKLVEADGDVVVRVEAGGGYVIEAGGDLREFDGGRR